MTPLSATPALSELDEWREVLFLGPSRLAEIHRGDVVLVTDENVDDIAEVMGALVTMVTHSVYYHALVYDHAWRFIHAFATRVFADDIQGFYLGKTNVTLTWLRPRHSDPAKIIGREETAAVVEFARRQIGKPYDLWANLAFLFRADGMSRAPDWLHALFQNRNWLDDHGKWHCSELVGAAWWHGCGVRFTDDMKSETFLSPADIGDSIYGDVVCTLKIRNGEYQLLTKQRDV
ncbi:MAG: hypothetical protein A2Y64_06720 [Candidatus Coatesbacteria bacterium RBG_13_66_14]|uniref:Uncharacterized protein n=1 Tax=Candidatus Coatesbacteria bacterium RBG_13_66_14 TaxID=1817816 RepID=A0A1F5FHK3_9BACT|nr:MAG: hypothetical protein A2Y64_06720 [Candidatus Coatesbacteria bacterium RBG_13_66_14]